MIIPSKIENNARTPDWSVLDADQQEAQKSFVYLSDQDAYKITFTNDTEITNAQMKIALKTLKLENGELVEAEDPILKKTLWDLVQAKLSEFPVKEKIAFTEMLENDSHFFLYGGQRTRQVAFAIGLDIQLLHTFFDIAKHI